MLRGRLDWMTMIDTHVVIVEYKTADDASRRVWERRAYNYGYHISAAWYLELVTLLGIDSQPEFLYVVQEKEPPYLPAVYAPDAELLLEGRARMREAINLYLECTYADVWPGYSNEIEMVGLPWAHTTTREEE